MTAVAVIIGGGPAGLTAAHELARAGRGAVVVERESQVGGLARTIWKDGYGFDIGGHRFFTKSERVLGVWQELLGEDLLTVRRLSRIYHDGRFFDYPLRPFNALSGLGVGASIAAIASYGFRKVRPLPEDGSFETYITNHFGSRLFNAFFKGYTEKVWGVPCSEIRADWAAQRIKDLSLWEAIRSSVSRGGSSSARSLVQEFQYPRLGPGMLWERMAAAVEQYGSPIWLNREVAGIRHNGQRVTAVVHRSTDACGGDGLEEQAAELVINTMPLQMLLRCMDPPPPDAVLDAAAALRYRDFITVNLVLEGPNPFPDQWIYVHSPDVNVGRIQNFANWSADLAAHSGSTGIGMEYFCSVGDRLWSMSDDALLQMAAEELHQLGLAGGCSVAGAFVLRVRRAYPLYDAQYREHLQTIRHWLSRFENLQTIGRAGLHQYNNQDHSMISAFRAVNNALHGVDDDLWETAAGSDYIE